MRTVIGLTLIAAWMLAQAHPVFPSTQIPQAARPYKDELTRAAKHVFGEAAPIALFSGLLEAESSWRPHVISPSGDIGLAQIGKNARIWLSRVKPGPGPGSPRDTTWSIKAMLFYIWHLQQAIKGAANETELYAFCLASYNGGLGNLLKERKLCTANKKCDPSKWFGNVELFRARSKRAYQENRTYVRRVMAFQEKYAAWGRIIKP